MPDAFAPAAAVLHDAVLARAFPSAVIEVGNTRGAIWTEPFGTLTYEPEAAAATLDTIYDLASLTKVIATTTLAMRAVDEGRLALADRLADRLADWRGRDREEVTVADLLAHASGLTGYLPLFRDHAGRTEFERTIGSLPLEYPPRSRSVYSDLGFMLLGFILGDVGETAAGRVSSAARWAQSLADQFATVKALAQAEPMQFLPPRGWRERAAPTEIDTWRGRLLVGEVHDENTWALGGVAAHAGLFGTARAVGSFARAVLRTIAGEDLLARSETFRHFIRRTGVPGSSRALGWDTMLPTSSCGTRMSPTAIGHTGFTGTSLWIDWERDLYVVLLTNRVHPTRANNAIRTVRRQVHDAVLSTHA